MDPNIEKVDLYVGEFYHNIDIDPNHTNYKKGTVIQDIRSIFDKKPKTDALTVAIDATIDFTNSADIKELLKEFEVEIKEGRLNLVVFRSGQKFDMLGLDNYYGGQFYIVNNGDKKWAAFNKIKTDKAFQNDDLSSQFFSWMAESGLELVEQYKKLIFENTRKILDIVPEGLQSKDGRQMSISSFENGVTTPFIEISLNFKDLDVQDELRIAIHKRFLELFIKEDKLVYVRGSFGFHHPNITWIDPKIRLNPGIDPSDLSLFQQLFKDLEVQAKKMSSK